MKKAQIKKSVSALAMAAVIAVSLFGYGCGAKPASTSSDAGVSGDFTGTAKGFGGDVSVTLTLTDGAITGCTAEGKDETQGVGSEAIAKMPGEIAESGSIAVDGVSGATVTSTAIKEAAAAALTAAGLNPDDYKTAVEKTGSAEDSTVEADVVVVGAGGAGMTAAITAAGEGKSVVILESQSMVGGNSVRATGGMNAGKTVYQDENEFGESAGVEKTLKTAAEKYADNETITALAKTVSEQWAAYQANPTGYFDSVELMELDTMIGGKGINDPELVETLCANSADAIDWLDEHGITLHNVSSFGGASVKRIHRPVNAEGKTVSVGSYMIPLLQENCEKAGVKMMLDTTATEILTDANGAAVGVKATGASGETVTVNAKAVVLASGGFGANLDMVVKYKPELKGFMTTNAPASRARASRWHRPSALLPWTWTRSRSTPPLRPTPLPSSPRACAATALSSSTRKASASSTKSAPVTSSPPLRSLRPAATAGWSSIRPWSMLPASSRATSRRATPSPALPTRSWARLWASMQLPSQRPWRSGTATLRPRMTPTSAAPASPTP